MHLDIWMAFYHEWDVKNDFACMLRVLSLIFDSLGSVNRLLLGCMQMVMWFFFGTNPVVPTWLPLRVVKHCQLSFSYDSVGSVGLRPNIE